MSYLPLCFPGIQILDVWVAISVAGTVYFPSLDSGKWSGLPRTPGTVSARLRSTGGKYGQQRPGWGLGDEVGMVTLFLAVVQGRSEKGEGKGATYSLHLLTSGLAFTFLPYWGKGPLLACPLSCPRSHPGSPG